MSDHERFLLLAAKRLGEQLTGDEQRALDTHLASCPSCATFASGMQGDDILLQTALEPVVVPSWMRQAVLAEAAPPRLRPAAGRIIFALAAAVGAGLLLSSWIGRSSEEVPSAPPATSVFVVPSPAGPASLPPIPSGTGPFIVAAYTYTDQAERRDTIVFRFDVGSEWSRTGTLQGEPVSFGGRNLRCVDIAGPDAWLAGVDESSGEDGTAILFYLHDGAAGGAPDDQVVGLVPGAAQTPDALGSWCYRHIIPAGPFDLSSGDVVVDYNGVEGR